MKALNNGDEASGSARAAELVERSILTSVLCSQGETIPPRISRLIDFSPNSFENPLAAQVASAIKQCRNNGTAPSFISVLSRLSGDSVQFAQDLANSTPLPLPLAEIDAEKILSHWRARQLIALLGEAWEEARTHPDKASSVGDIAVKSIKNLMAEAPSDDSKLTILRFSQILELKRDESDRILGDNLLNKGSPLVIAGQGGTGKSRLLFQFLAACKMGFDKFLTFDIHPGARDLRWLIIQSENSPWRLQDEARKYLKWMSEEAWAAFDASIFVLCPTEEHDSMLSLNDEETVTRIHMALDEFKPDGVIADPLGEFSTGDLNKDVDMKSTILSLSRTIRHGNPKRSLVIAHHALTGQAGAAKAVGYDRSSFARNSKVLFNWTRAQINVAPMSEDNNDQLSISCGKCSDGREFQPFAVKLNPDTMIYECDPTVDVAEWAKEIKTGKKGNPLISSENIRDLCDLSGSTKSDLSKAIQDETGCARQSSYRLMASAEHDKKIRWSNAQKRYYKN